MSVDYLPVWKRGATAEERFSELSQVAAKHPEIFSRVAVVYEEMTPEGNTRLRYISTNLNTTELIGMLEFAQRTIMDDCKT